MSLPARLVVIVLICGFVLFGGDFVSVSLGDVRLTSRGATRIVNLTPQLHLPLCPWII